MLQANSTVVLLHPPRKHYGLPEHKSSTALCWHQCCSHFTGRKSWCTVTYPSLKHSLELNTGLLPMNPVLEPRRSPWESQKKGLPVACCPRKGSDAHSYNPWQPERMVGHPRWHQCWVMISSHLEGKEKNQFRWQRSLSSYRISKGKGFFFPPDKKKYFQESSRSNNVSSQWLYLFLCFLAPDLSISQKRGTEGMGVQDRHKGKGREKIKTNSYIYRQHVPIGVKTRVTSFHT